MKVSAFLKMCRINHLIPNMFNIESLQEMMMETIPPITTAENDYFLTQQCLLKTYQKDTAPSQTLIIPLEKDEEYAQDMASGKPECEEPGLLFHEFVFLLGLIAIKYQQLEMDNTDTCE